MKPDELKALRRGASLSQADLAEKLNLSQALVSNWESGKSDIKGETLEKIRSVLGTLEESVTESPLASWISKARMSKGMSVPELANASGITPQAIYRIESGKTTNLRDATKKKLEKALDSKLSEEAEVEVSEDAEVVGLGALEDFDPHSDSERPALPGIYVLYDISDRPVYVGEGSNVKKRIKDHEEKFWFKRPIVESASWIRVEETELRKQIERILIKFLKSNAVINKQNVER